MQQPRQRLHGFAETHVVREDAAKIVRGKMGEKVKSFLLVMPERCAQARRQRRRGQRCEGERAVAQLGCQRGIADGERSRFARQLERVHPVFGRSARCEDIADL